VVDLRRHIFLAEEKAISPQSPEPLHDRQVFLSIAALPCPRDEMSGYAQIRRFHFGAPSDKPG
jgi:hypothetical protein